VSYLGLEEGDDGERDEEEHGHESSVELDVVLGGEDPSDCQLLIETFDGLEDLLERSDEERFNKVEWGWAVCQLTDYRPEVGHLLYVGVRCSDYSLAPLKPHKV
jgi:hypothetical protein